MGQAITNVQHLTIDTTAAERSSTSDVAVLLHPLVQACHAVQYLNTKGGVSPDLLSALGASSGKLSSFETSDTSTHLLHDLQSLIPSLTHFSLHDFHRPFAHISKRALACCLSQLSSTVLTDLSIGPFTPSLSMWRSLPPGLKRLHCTLDGGIPDDVRVLVSLEHFTYLRKTGTNKRIDHHNRFPLRTMADVLNLAPQLQSVTLVGEAAPGSNAADIPHIMGECTDCTIPNLHLLHHRVLSGLVVTATVQGDPRVYGLYLHLWIEDFEDDMYFETRGMGVFLAHMPAFPAFTKVFIEDLCFRQQDERVFAEVTKPFPNLVSLEFVYQYWIHDGDFEDVTAYTALQHLSVNRFHHSPAELAKLCARLVSLRVLKLDCKQCRHFSAVEVTELQDLLLAQGSDVTVLCTNVRDEVLPLHS
ncbi:MAG: hypothetical protein WDW38_010600 [Sanguina aurantia]